MSNTERIQANNAELREAIEMAEKLPDASEGGTPTPTQEKTVDITENGTHTVIPDDGYALSKVTANVSVPIPVPGGGTSVQTDWNQNDETEPDFIKNQPFGETPTVLYEGTDLAPMDEDGDYILELPTLEFAEGVQYTVVIDGEEYAVEGTNSFGFVFIGNPVVSGGADNGLPFTCMPNTDTGEGTIFASFISFTSLRIVESSIKKIEQKYLPASAIVLERNIYDADNARYLYKTQSGDESDRVTLNELRAFVRSGMPIYLNSNGRWFQPMLISVYELTPYGYVEIMMENGEQRKYYTAEYTA